MSRHPQSNGARFAFAVLVFCLLPSCGEGGEGGATGNTELNVIIPNGSPDRGPLGSGSTDPFDPKASSALGDVEVQTVEYTINCAGTAQAFLDDNTPLPNNGAVRLIGELEVADDEPNLNEAELWQGVVDLPLGLCTIDLRARDADGEVICSAQEGFQIVADATTEVNLVLICGVSFQAPVGILDVDATFTFTVGNYCPDLFRLNCVPQAQPVEVFDDPIAGPAAAAGCQVRARDLDGDCGTSCDPQACFEYDAGILCSQPGGPDIVVPPSGSCPGSIFPEGCFYEAPAMPELTTTVTCLPTPATVVGLGAPSAAVDCDFDDNPDWLPDEDANGNPIPCTTATQVADCPSGVCAVPPGTCLIAGCEFTGDIEGTPGLQQHPLSPGEGGFVIPFTLCTQDIIDQTLGTIAVCMDPAQIGLPLSAGATMKCTAVTNDGDDDCEKMKTVTIAVAGDPPCVQAGCLPGQPCPSFCNAGNDCQSTVCDDSGGTAECNYDSLSAGTWCNPMTGDPGECNGSGTCDPVACVIDDDCNIDGNPCTDAEPGACDSPGTGSCSGNYVNNTDSCDSGAGAGSGTCGGGSCIDNCATTDCSNGNDCSQALCDPQLGVGAPCADGGACCSNPDEPHGTSCDLGGGPGSCAGGVCGPPLCTVVYDLDATFQVTDTLGALGDTTFTGLTGSLAVEYTADGVNNIADGPVNILHYSVYQDFSVTGALEVVTTVHGYAPSCNGMPTPPTQDPMDPSWPTSCDYTGNIVPVASGVLDTGTDAITWDACSAAPDYWTTVVADYTSADVSTGSGCLNNYRSYGMVVCAPDGTNSGFCSFGNLVPGANPADASWVQPLINGPLVGGTSSVAVANDAQVSSITTPIGASGGTAPATLPQSYNVPNDTPSRTWIGWTATRDDANVYTTCN